MKKGITIIFLLLFSVLLFNNVSAVPPFEENAGTLNGLQIFEPKYEAVKYNTSFSPHLHVSNLSNGMPMPNTAVSCYLHLYDMAGDHLYESGVLEKDANGWDHEITLLAGNFTQSGEYNAYFIWCNSSEGLGGEVKGTYEITGNGKPTPEGIVILGFSIVMVFLFMMIIVYIIRAVGLMIDTSLDILDVAYAWGLYFGLLGLNLLATIYLGNVIIMNWLSLFVTVFGFPLMIVPILAFFLSVFAGKERKKKEANAW